MGKKFFKVGVHILAYGFEVGKLGIFLETRTSTIGKHEPGRLEARLKRNQEPQLLEARHKRKQESRLFEAGRVEI